MFICQSCQKQVEPGVPCNVIVAKQAPIQHPFRYDVGLHWGWDVWRQRWKRVWYDDEGGPGTRIVKELKVCPTCAGNKHA